MIIVEQKQDTKTAFTLASYASTLFHQSHNHIYDTLPLPPDQRIIQNRPKFVHKMLNLLEPLQSRHIILVLVKFAIENSQWWSPILNSGYSR